MLSLKGLEMEPWFSRGAVPERKVPRARDLRAVLCKRLELVQQKQSR